MFQSSKLGIAFVLVLLRNRSSSMEDRKQPLKRRGLLGGAATLGALAAAATLLPSQEPPAQAPDAAAKSGDAGKTAKDGYQLTAHVQHYYQTARI
jgi:hypothetical protein